MLPMIEIHRAEVANLCRPLGVRRLDVFGSAVSGCFDAARSDLDFLVEFDNLEPAVYAEAWLLLHEQLESLFGCPVDLVTLAAVRNPYFRERALAVRETVYAA
jgi:predicted nucleotidyltransferase